MFLGRDSSSRLDIVSKLNHSNTTVTETPVKKQYRILGGVSLALSFALGASSAYAQAAPAASTRTWPRRRVASRALRCVHRISFPVLLKNNKRLMDVHVIALPSRCAVVSFSGIHLSCEHVPCMCISPFWCESGLLLPDGCHHVLRVPSRLLLPRKLMQLLRVSHRKVLHGDEVSVHRLPLWAVPKCGVTDKLQGLSRGACKGAACKHQQNNLNSSVRSLFSYFT